MPHHQRFDGYRAFHPDFILRVQRRGKFPRNEVLRQWLKTKFAGLKADYASDVIHGRYVPEKACYGLVDFAMSPRNADEAQHVRAAISDYLRDSGVDPEAPLDVESVVAHVCTEPATTKPDSYSGDPMMSGLDECLGTLFQHQDISGVIDSAVIGFPRDEDERTSAISEAVRFLFVQVGKLTSVGGPRLSHDAATTAAIAHIKTQQERYLSRALAWHAKYRWAVVQARGKEAPVGLSIVLPLTEKAYDDLKSARRPAHDLSHSDLVRPSRHLWIEACVEYPAAAADPNQNSASRLLKCIAMQLAVFMQHTPNQPDTDYNWLSFAGTPRSRARLIGSGFAPLARPSATGQELLERKVSFSRGAGLRINTGAVLMWGARDCPIDPPES